MQHLYVYDDTALTIEDLAEKYGVPEAEIVQSLVDALEDGAFNFNDYI